MMTPALLVPDTPEGKVYKALPALFAEIANRVQENAGKLNLISALNGWMTEGAAEHLHRLLLAQLADFDFGTAQQIGAAGMIEWIQQMPLFTWDINAPAVEVPIWIAVAEKVQPFKLPIQARREGLYAVHPAFAYAYLGMMPNKQGERTYIDEGGGVCYAVYDPHYGVLFSQGFVNTTAQAISDMVLQLQYGANYVALGRSLWSLLPEFSQTFEDIIRSPEGDYMGIESRIEPRPDFAEATVFPWPASFANHPNLLIKPFAELATKLHQARGKKERGEWIQIVGIALAAIGGITAIESIASQGAGFANVAKLVGSIDNLPGVDLGVAGDIAKGLSAGINLANKIPGGVQMFEFDDDVAELVDVSLDDIGAALDPDFDFSVFEAFGLDGTELLTDDIGNVFTVAGDAVTLDPETYVKSIYLDEAGNYRDFSNNVILSQADAEQVFNESGFDDAAVQQELFGRVQGIGGQYFDTVEGAAARPAGVPNPASQVQVPFFQSLSQEVLSWFKTITQYSLAKEQLEKTGRYTPPYATSAVGTPYSQVPGVPVRRADGAIVTNNGNGTQTVQLPNGVVQTMPSSFSPGMTGGGQLIAGISNQTLLLAGAGLLAVLLIARR